MDTINRLSAPFTRRPRHPDGAPLRRLVATGRTVFTVIGRTLSLWQDRARQRAHLASLDDRILRDIGISRVEVAREASKPFWRA